MKKLDTTSTFYTPEDAEALAEELNATDDWIYVARHDPAGTGFSLVDVYDEEGELVATM